MKALVYTGPENLIFQDADYPFAGEGEVIVKVDSVGICGSDMHAFLGHDERRPAPLILGHEVAGVVVDGAALSLACFGAKDITIVEPNERRHRFLSKITDFRLKDPGELEADAGFDIAIDAVGYAATRETASRSVCPGGVIMHIGLGVTTGGLDIRRMTLQEITFIGTYTYTATDFRATARAIFYGHLGPLDWYETRPLSDGLAAFNDIRKGATEAAKTILKP